MADADNLQNKLRLAATGDAQCWQDVIAAHTARLRRMVVLRLDHRLQGRIDPSDVLQEAYFEAAEHLVAYLEKPMLPFYLWLRLLVTSRLHRLHRHHLGTQKRSAKREISMFTRTNLSASSIVIADHLVDSRYGPAEQAAKDEMKQYLRAALDAMDPLDREALVLRHFEQLSSAEVAQILQITEKAASKRYLRALERLKNAMMKQGSPSWL